MYPSPSRTFWFDLHTLNIVASAIEVILDVRLRQKQPENDTSDLPLGVASRSPAEESPFESESAMVWCQMLSDLEAVAMTEEDPWESERSETSEQVYDLESVEGRSL